jgi:hypothetical protein
MSSGQKVVEALFNVGDIIDEGDDGGVIVAGAVVPETGQAGYLFLGHNGLNFQYHNAVKSGIRLSRRGAVLDLEGRDFLAGPQTVRSPKAVMEAGPMADERNEMLGYLEHLMDLVGVNGRPGTAVARAFAALHDSFNREDGPTWGEVHAAMQTWQGLDASEKCRVLNGWRPDAKVASVREVIEKTLREATGESAARVLTLNFHRRGVFVGPEVALTHGLTDHVTVTIREGTSREEAIAELRAALAAVRSQWEKMIDLEDGKFLTVPRVEEVPAAARAEKQPRSLSADSRKPGRRESRKSKAAA